MEPNTECGPIKEEARDPLVETLTERAEQLIAEKEVLLARVAKLEQRNETLRKRLAGVCRTCRSG